MDRSIYISVGDFLELDNMSHVVFTYNEQVGSHSEIFPTILDDLIMRKNININNLIKAEGLFVFHYSGSFNPRCLSNLDWIWSSGGTSCLPEYECMICFEGSPLTVYQAKENLLCIANYLLSNGTLSKFYLI